MIIHWIKKKIARALHEPQNILESALRVPETVYIVAGGPNGIEHYHRIPKNGYVIAVNKAVLIPEIQPDMWVLNSMNRGIRLWIGKAHRLFEGIRIFRQSCIERIPLRIRRKVHYTYVPNQGKDNKYNRRLDPNTLRSGGTVSGFAIQIAAHLGARKIVLCGVDMSGQGYWDGRTGDNRNHGEVWSYTGTVNLIIQDLQKEYNLSISSLSPTQLNVPMC
jgi:hypothetical protein